MFTGRRFDIETGLYYYRARYYNPHIGRFMQTDPVGYGNGINWYAYCGNDPLNYVDPSGLFYVTGRQWILPRKTTPGKAADLLSAKEMAGFMVDIASDHVSWLEYWEYAEKMATKIGERIGAEYWIPYIEVYDCNDKNGDGKIDEDEKTYYWIEVAGIGAYDDDDEDRIYNRNAWVPGAGYLTWAEAVSAAGTAIDWAWRNGGVVPETTTYYMRGNLSTEYSGETYVTSNPIRANLNFLEEVKTAKKWIERWKKVYNIITTEDD